MKYEISEILGQSIMTKTPTIIVEGVDDVKIYDSIVSSINAEHFVLPIECVDGYSEGNEHVIDAMNFIREMPASRYDYRDFIIGIIDKDVRDFRNEIPDNELIFPLKVYSIESHFVNKENILSLLKEITRITRDLALPELENIIVDDIFSNFEDLFILSLDALKGATNQDYQSIFSYSYNDGRVINQRDIQLVLARKSELLEFASSLGIEYSLDSLKLISKGKWLIFLYCHHLERAIKNLPALCGAQKIHQCRVCESDIHKCLYKTKDGFTSRTIKSIVMNDINLSELQYIKSRLHSMIPA